MNFIGQADDAYKIALCLYLELEYQILTQVAVPT